MSEADRRPEEDFPLPLGEKRLRPLHALGGLEGLGCDVPLDPGDVLFFREDLFHRTQDVLHDRIALIIDVWRMPLAANARYRPEMRW